MTLSVHSNPAATGPLDEISPELVLVDPELAKLARSRLPAQPAAPHTRPAPAVQVPPVAAVPSARTRPRPVEHRTSRRALVGVAAVTMLVLLLFDVRVEVGDRPASSAISEPPETTVPPTPAPTTPSRPSPVKPKPAPAKGAPGSRGKRAGTARRFAWAPTPGASGYHVEFFRGATRVYAQETAAPTLEVPARWRYEGVERRFRPGTYRWYVWPVVGGERATRAAVQTTVSIPRG
jgi:hypothetical protein